MLELRYWYWYVYVAVHSGSGEQPTLDMEDTTHIVLIGYLFHFSLFHFISKLVNLWLTCLGLCCDCWRNIRRSPRGLCARHDWWSHRRTLACQILYSIIITCFSITINFLFLKHILRTSRPGESLLFLLLFSHKTHYTRVHYNTSIVRRLGGLGGLGRRLCWQLCRLGTPCVLWGWVFIHFDVGIND